jgi:hypothetical protein
MKCGDKLWLVARGLCMEFKQRKRLDFPYLVSQVAV